MMKNKRINNLTNLIKNNEYRNIKKLEQIIEIFKTKKENSTSQIIKQYQTEDE